MTVPEVFFIGKGTLLHTGVVSLLFNRPVEPVGCLLLKDLPMRWPT